MADGKLAAITAKQAAAIQKLDALSYNVNTALRDPTAPGNEILAEVLRHMLEEMKSIRQDVTELSSALAGGIDPGTY